MTMKVRMTKDQAAEMTAALKNSRIPHKVSYDQYGAVVSTSLFWNVAMNLYLAGFKAGRGCR